MPLEFKHISADRLKTLSRGDTVFFFSVGPLEDHGPHLPMGLDLAEASRLSWLAAERLEREMPGWTGVLMPEAPLGLESDTSEIAITVRPHVLRDWLVDACRSLERAGFRNFVCFSGHLGPRQLTAIEDAGKLIARWPKGILPLPWFKRGPVLISASSANVAPAIVRASPFLPDPLEHGGARDTSVALAICAGQVGAEYSGLPDFPRSGTHVGRAWKRLRGRLSGYWGKPAAASAEAGAATLNGSLEAIFPKLRAVLEGSNPNALFRSWYSVIPPNKSFFKAWLLAALFFSVMVIWILLTMSVGSR